MSKDDRSNVQRIAAVLKGFDTANTVTPIVPVMTKTTDITLAMTRLGW